MDECRASGPRQGSPRVVPSGIRTFDAPDCLVTPGFVDGHTHFAMWALNRRRVQLAGVTSGAMCCVALRPPGRSRGGS